MLWMEIDHTQNATEVDFCHRDKEEGVAPISCEVTEADQQTSRPLYVIQKQGWSLPGVQNNEPYLKPLNVLFDLTLLDYKGRDTERAIRSGTDQTAI